MYAQFDSNGEIVGISKDARPGYQSVPSSDPRVVRFIAGAADEDSPLAFLEQTDLELIRVLEDLVDVLVQNNVIHFTDLPSTAQKKLLHRRTARNELQSHKSAGLLTDDDILI
jgi:hypothetical protein